MSKRSPAKPTSRRNIYIGAGIGLVVIALIGFFALRGPASAAAQALSPAAYQSQFIASGAPHFLLDVRTDEEFGSGHIHGAVNIPVDALENRLSEVPKDQPIVVYCRSGNRSAQASRILEQAGYTTIYDLGGLNDWTAQGFPVE
jgi:rhodanese-related sulfurtransferase